MEDSRGRFIGIVIVTLALAYIAVGSLGVVKNWPMPGLLKGAKIQPGIDLAGGAELTYRLLHDPSKPKSKSEVGQQVVSVLQQRINTKGLKEPRITTQGDEYVVIQLAGVDQYVLQDYKDLIGQVGNLELKKVATKEVHDKFNSDGIVPDGYEKHPAPTESDKTVYPWIKDSILLEKAAVITGQDVENAYHEVDIRGGKGRFKINFQLKSEGAKKFDFAAQELFNRDPNGQIAIVIDNILKSAPVVQAEEFGGRGEITGNFDEREAKDLAIVLRSGSLPVPIGRLDGDKPVPKFPEAENFVGPSLGQDAIKRGLIASIATLVGVALFMLVYYRAGGFVAVITIALNMTYLMAIMAFFNATLTLPGIAGIALTIGMAVDANILIYERMREELAKGKTLMQAFEAGHDRAFVTIMDANLTTLLAALVLYYFGTGAVQGFAVTLSIGIITTLVSVLFAGKTILHMLISRGSITEMRMMKVMANPNYQFVKYLKPAIIGSFLLIVASMAVFFVRGEKNFGPDFRGGSMLNFAFKDPKDIEWVRGRVHSIEDPTTKQKRYPDAQIQTIAEPGTFTVGITGGLSRQFAVRDGTQDIDGMRGSVQEVFKEDLSHEPFQPVPAADLPENPKFFESGPAGAGLYVFLLDDGKFKLDDAKKQMREALKGVLDLAPDGLPELEVEQKMEGVPKGLLKLKVIISARDHAKEGGDRIRKMRDTIKTLGANKALALSPDPFVASGKIGPTVAAELKDSSIIAMIISWVLMIGYIAVRFSSWRFGVAAVIALVHDALISIGVVAVLGAVVPKAWGLSFDMNMTFVAAILTVIGFSVNDTIVIFDRIRENLGLMKKESFAEIINVSVNQTLSRTILTALTVWITVIVLYVATMTSGGGIAEFSLPLIIGVLAGSYSTVYIASPIVLWWYKGTKPQLT